MRDMTFDSSNDWTVDLRNREAMSNAAYVTFCWTSDGHPQVYVVRPRLPGLTECDARRIAQAAQRAIAAASSRSRLSSHEMDADPVR